MHLVIMELEDILVKSPLPLHPSLAGHPRLSVKVVMNGKAQVATPFAPEMPQGGVWEMSGTLEIPTIGADVSLMIMADGEHGSKEIILAEIETTEFSMRVKKQPDLEYHEIPTCHSRSPVQMILRCSIKDVLSPIYSTEDALDGGEDPLMGDRQEIPSREWLENMYSRVTRLEDRNACAHDLNIIGYNFYKLYQENNVVADLERAIFILEEAMQYASVFGPQPAKYSSDLGEVFMERFTQKGDINDIEKATKLCQDAVKVSKDADEDMAKWLLNLGNCYEFRFDIFGKMEDINEAIAIRKRSVVLMHKDDANRPQALENSAGALLKRFRQSGSMYDLTESILFQQEVVDLTPHDDPYTPGRLNKLAISLQLRFERLGNIEDREKATVLFKSVVNLTPDDHPDKPARLSNLGSTIQSSFNSHGNIRDLESAISFKQAAVNLMPDDHPDKPALLSNLGVSIQSCFKILGNIDDLERAISLQQKAVDLTPRDHPDKPRQLNNLGSAVESRFDILGEIEDLESAISLQQAAVDLTPDGHPDKPRWLYNLGRLVQSRFQRRGEIEDLECSILSQQAAVTLTPDGCPNKPKLLNGLGMAVESRFDRLGDIEDLESAIALQQAAVNFTPDGHPDKPALLSSLGRALQSRFSRLGNIKDIESAISFKQAVVNLTPDDGHPDKPRRLNNLGSAVRSRFDRLGDVEDLKSAISFQQAAVNLMPDGHPDKLALLSNHGQSLFLRFQIMHHQADLESAIVSFSAAATSPTGQPILRFRAAVLWAEACLLCNQSPLNAFQCAIDTLPQVAWLGTPLSNQHAQLTQVGDLVRYAVAVATELQEYETAVRWAEYGRSIVWQNLLGLRKPLDNLRKAYPELATRLQSISLQLEGSLSRHDHLGESKLDTLQNFANKASMLAAERDKIIEQTRKLPGFEDFLRAKPVEKLAPAAYEGPVAIINVHKIRCDALILVPHDSHHQTTSIVTIPLKSFSYDMSVNLFKKFSQILSSERVRARGDRQGFRLQEDKKKVSLDSILVDLWIYVVKPVLEGLGYRVSFFPGYHSRIWWCATGPLAFLPIHAAGNYGSDAVGEKISDYVISSYTPTLTALIEQSQPEITDDFQILTVAQPSTPGQNPLPQTTVEVEHIQEAASSMRVQSLTGDEATTARVLKSMKESNWIHLACHGLQYRGDSLKSGFLLHDKTLELSDLIKEPFVKSDFAFLSACQTATGDENIAEESVHLAAGMLFSGCKGVIGTMWSIQDNDAPKVTKAVYERMLKGGIPNRKEAARALHEAVKELRESGSTFTSWVPFIHIGR
ncbi:hypothetical protein M408DRAFT_312371 [Serendipita vermifera MAFF 305830]|uniref:CHAT domain-containing protein n=1 Tax=Serendipita vermifera MAFF 305830 TaxID=933852 RepID=A0A0C2XC34_SERVB|nr:hypothetical protein M408DRAFT_312371 [Serendipita vermifera MAFF 305830]